jgi:hypothetical protein
MLTCTAHLVADTFHYDATMYDQGIGNGKAAQVSKVIIAVAKLADSYDSSSMRAHSIRTNLKTSVAANAPVKISVQREHSFVG